MQVQNKKQHESPQSKFQEVQERNHLWSLSSSALEFLALTEVMIVVTGPDNCVTWVLGKTDLEIWKQSRMVIHSTKSSIILCPSSILLFLTQWSSPGMRRQKCKVTQETQKTDGRAQPRPNFLVCLAFVFYFCFCFLNNFRLIEKPKESSLRPFTRHSLTLTLIETNKLTMV